jgi:predicted RecA/RadA family phage recombinase
MVNYVQDGDTITLVAPYAVASGAGALVGTIFGVAMNAVANAVEGEFRIKGVFDLAKSTGVNWVQGAKLYWDNAAKSVTNVASSNTFIGCAMQAQINGDTTCRIRLNGVSV